MDDLSGVVSFFVQSHPVCLYPSPQYLKKKRNIRTFSKKPYSKQLALGAAQFKTIFFEIEVLERYYRDPRFKFKFSDYSGAIETRYDENNESLLKEKDKIFLKTFGLGVNENGERVAVAFLRYLNGMREEHQQYWKSKEISGKCYALEDYYDTAMGGKWPTSCSVFSAFIGEQKAINDLTVGIFGTPLFRQSFSREDQPKEFTFFFMPTTKNYHDFVLVLDKMVSDNINKEFFKRQMETVEEKKLSPGVVERKEKGTIRLLQEWLSMNYSLSDDSIINELFKPFRTIRSERQTPAHKLNEDVYDKSLIEKQKTLIKDAYSTMKTLRLILQKHPKSAAIKVSSWLDSAEVKVY